MAYKKNVDDIRESPALRLIQLLLEKEAIVAYHDPHIPTFDNLRDYDFEMASVSLEPTILAEQDAVLIVTDHDNVDYDMILCNAPLVVDTRNATRNLAGRSQIVQA